MLKNLVFAALDNFDKDCLFVKGTLGDFVIEDFNVCVDKNFITIKGFEWDKCEEERTGYIKEFKIDSSELTDFEELSSPGCDFIALGINNGMGFIEMYDCY